MNEDLNTKIQAIHDKYQKQREVLLAKRLGYSQSSDKQQLDNGRAYGQVGNSIGKDQNIVNNNSTNIHKYRYEIYNNNKIQNQSNIGASINYTRNSIYDKYTTRNTTHTATTSTPIDTYTKYDKFGGYVKDSKKYADLYENKYARGLHYNDLKNNRTFYGGVSTNRYY